MADIESAATTPSSRPVEALDQGEEPQPAVDGAGDGVVRHKQKSCGSFSETYSECSDCAVSELSTGVTFVV